MPSFQADAFFIEDPNDSSKRLRFDVSGLAPGTTRIIKPNPNGDGTMAFSDAGNEWTVVQTFGAGIQSAVLLGGKPAIKVFPWPGQTQRMFEAVDAGGNTLLALAVDGTINRNGQTAVSGSFQTPDGKTVTVTGGIVTGIA